MSSKLLVPAFLLSILSYPNSCENVSWDDKLVLEQQEYSSNQLKINGYYYQKGDNKYYTIYFFYEDGTVLDGGGNYTEEELIKQEKKYSSDAWSNFAKKHKDLWGLFNIDGDMITFERWHSSSGGPKPAYIRSGKILNDTTFVITKSIRSKNGKEERQLNETYHFRKFSPKPDSTNNFIK